MSSIARSWRHPRPGTPNIPFYSASLNCTPADVWKSVYEDLGSSITRQGLADFLRTSPFDFASEMATVKDSADKTSPAAVRIQQRMRELEPRVEALTRQASDIHGYVAGVDAIS